MMCSLVLWLGPLLLLPLPLIFLHLNMHLLIVLLVYCWIGKNFLHGLDLFVFSLAEKVKLIGQQYFIYLQNRKPLHNNVSVFLISFNMINIPTNEMKLFVYGELIIILFHVVYLGFSATDFCIFSFLVRGLCLNVLLLNVFSIVNFVFGLGLLFIL